MFLKFFLALFSVTPSVSHFSEQFCNTLYKFFRLRHTLSSWAEHTRFSWSILCQIRPYTPLCCSCYYISHIYTTSRGLIGTSSPSCFDCINNCVYLSSADTLGSQPKCPYIAGVPSSEWAKFITRHSVSFNKHVNTMYMYIYIYIHYRVQLYINLVPRLHCIENCELLNHSHTSVFNSSYVPLRCFTYFTPYLAPLSHSFRIAALSLLILLIWLFPQY